MKNESSHRPPSPSAADRVPTVASLLTPEQVAAGLGVSTKTLTNWRSRGTGPSYVRVAGRVYYSHRAYTQFWLEQTGGAA